MPQLIPYFFFNQVSFSFIVFVISIFIYSKYILPLFIYLFVIHNIFINLK